MKWDGHGAFHRMVFGYMVCRIEIAKVENDKFCMAYFCIFWDFSEKFQDRTSNL